MEESRVDNETAVQTPVTDPVKLAELVRQLKSEQNLMRGIFAGVAAGIVGAAVWAIVTVMTQYQIGWMAVGVGFLVGYAVRLLGKGMTKTFGVLGATCALCGCVLGNVLSVCGFVSREESVPFLLVAVNVLLQPAMIFEMLKATFSPMDLLFYGIAVYEGYRLSFRQITQQELSELVPVNANTDIE